MCVCVCVCVCVFGSLSHLETMTNEFVSCVSGWGLTVSVPAEDQGHGGELL